MIPRQSFSATSITTSSDILGDPATVALANLDAATRDVETTDAALARIIAALGEFMPSWHRDPARGCAGMAPATFISKQPKARAAAFAACGACPTEIRRACLAWAIDVNDRQAIAGGMDPPARARLARQRQADTEGDTDVKK